MFVRSALFDFVNNDADDYRGGYQAHAERYKSGNRAYLKTAIRYHGYGGDYGDGKQYAEYYKILFRQIILPLLR